MRALKNLAAGLFLAALSLASPAHAQTVCNDPAGFVKSFGQFTTGDVAVFGPGCEQLSDGGGPPSPPIRSVTNSTDQASIGDCGKKIVFSGNTQTVETVLATTVYGTCQLTFINSNTYAGAVPGGCGIGVTCTGSNSAGIIMKIVGFSDFALYPGQSLILQGLGAGAWIPDTSLAGNGAFGKVWAANFNVTFFVDTSGSDTDTDGLAPGARAFRTLQHCETIAYSQVYTRNLGSIVCMPTAGQAFQEFLQIFYPLSGGGTLLFLGNNGQFTWKPPNSSLALQFGDGALVGLTQVAFDSTGVTGATGFVLGHNHGVLDVNQSVSINGGGTGAAFDCDYDTHFNFNNGFTSNGPNTQNFFFQTCPRSVWNISNTFTQVGAPPFGRWANIRSNSTVQFAGNLAFSGAFGALSPMLVTGNSLLENLSGIATASLPGGAPTVTSSATGGWGALCTGAC